ncbi:MAG TPA: hypothetical protein VKS98_08045 [Chthoniobacterales bacterium]|nr:hypothetical protein [Chthoniobacterales bacterium]
MDYGLYRYDEPYARPVRRRINYFAWTVAILLLTGFAFAAWLGSFYIFSQPERPDSYRILQKLHKIEPPKRFELTAAPPGEFLSAKQLYDRYNAMGSAEFAKTNAELARNYIRNFQQVRGLIQYVVGRYVIEEARDLSSSDIFTSGMVALTDSVENPELLMEHVYPAEPPAVPMIRQTLTTGLELKMDRAHDLSAVIHVERFNDGRVMVTAVPLLYGTYTVMRGTGTFSLEPPLSLNLEAGWPLFKEQSRLRAEMHFTQFKQSHGQPQAPSQVAIPGFAPSGSPPPAENQLIRVEAAKPVETPPVVQVGKKGKPGAKPTPTPKGKLAKGKPTPKASASASPVTVAENVPYSPPPTSSMPVTQASPATQKLAAGKNAATSAPAPAQSAPEAAMAQAVPTPGRAQPVAPDMGTLASTTGGGTWKTFPAGRMPLGRLIGTSDLKEIANQGTGGERIYLKGQFVVNFSDANRAVLRPRGNLTDSVLHFGSAPTRIIVEFPAGYTPPSQGSTVNRDEARPLEITQVQKQEDGQLNVFAREIMQ